MSLVKVSGNASGTGTLTIAAPNTNSDYTLTLPQTTATLGINGPAFSAYASAGQAISANTNTKVVFDTERFDTNNNFASSRFTPTVAGYYQFNTNIYAAGGTMTNTIINFYKNGALYSQPVYIGTTYIMQCASDLIYLNGSTDYVEVYFLNQNACTVNNGAPGSAYVQFSGSLVRAA